MSSLHRCVHGNIPSCKSRQNITSLLKQPKEGSSCEAYTYSVGSEWMSQSHESLVIRVRSWQIAREKEGTQTVKKTIYPSFLPEQQLGFRERFFDSNQIHINIRFGMQGWTPRPAGNPPRGEGGGPPPRPALWGRGASPPRPVP